MTRNKKPVKAFLDPDLAKRVEAYLDSLPVRPTMTALIETALKHFLKKKRN